MAFIAPAIGAIGSFLGSAEGILLAASTGFGAMTSIQQGNYQAAVAKNNAVIADQNAQAESEASQRQQIYSDREYAAAAAEQLAQQGASGIDILGKTQLASRDVTQATGRAAAGNIRAQGTNTARRFLNDAANFRSEADAAKKQGITNAIGIALDSAGKIAGGAGGGGSSMIGGAGKSKKYPWQTNASWYGRG